MNDQEANNGTVMISVKKAATLLDVSSRTIWRMIADGQLKSVRIRHCTRLALSQVLSLANGQGKVVAA